MSVTYVGRGIYVCIYIHTHTHTPFSRYMYAVCMHGRMPIQDGGGRRRGADEENCGRKGTGRGHAADEGE